MKAGEMVLSVSFVDHWTLFTSQLKHIAKIPIITQIKKIPPLDGCGRREIALFLQRKPNLDGIWGSARNFVCRMCTQFPGSPYEIANPSIYLIDKGCMLHESGYNVHCESFLVYGECPCTISHAALSTVSHKA